MKKILLTLVITAISFTAASKDKNSNFSNSEICKAGIAASVFRKPKGIKAISSQKNNITIFYIRDDGRKYTYQCRIQNKEIRWKDQTMSKWNRNLKLFYKISKDGKQITIDTVAFGDTISKTYAKSDF